ncbi:hypothetical protein AYK24_07965 [Thermoplasmatales archaeon SG8-52-4]|nr:MAG: hypothetical protein AYK24_07965 [Thermoplasmatales archaeon SG8-52-4]
MSDTNRFSIIPDYGDPNNPKIRAKYGYLEAAVSIICNTLLFLLKLILGLFINSIALIADGVHSLSDVSTSGVVIFGFRIAKKEPDKDHPFGHGRAEYIATLIIAIILVLVGFGFIEQSIERIINIENISHQEFAIIIIFIVLISAVFKELMARYSNAIAKKINSDVLKADAWHHRSDAISSIGVAIGILGARLGFPILDPIFGIFVAVIIIYVGIDLMRKSSNFLMGTKVEKDKISNIGEIIKNTQYVEGIHKIFLHDYGTNKVITLHVEIESNLSIEKAHSIADVLEQKIQEKTNCSTVIHLEPKNNKKDTKNGNKIIEKILKTQIEVKSYHKIQIIKGLGKDDIKMHLIVDHNMPVQKAHNLCHRIEKILQKAYGSCNVDVHFEPCGNNCEICKISCKDKK